MPLTEKSKNTREFFFIQENQEILTKLDKALYCKFLAFNSLLAATGVFHELLL